MAFTLEQYAPELVALGFETSQAVTFFENTPAVPEPPTPPQVTKAKVVALARIMTEDGGLGANGGLIVAAHTVNMTVADTRYWAQVIKRAYEGYKFEQSQG